MNTCSWFHVGLSLMGVYLLVKVFIAIPAFVQVASFGATDVMVSTVLAASFQLIAGMFLIIKAPRLAGGLTDRLDRSGMPSNKAIQTDRPSAGR